VFIVDEFQQYAKRGKQQMLYYLLDMLQVVSRPCWI
jgi:origin recognition complex subunit 4